MKFYNFMQYCLVCTSPHVPLSSRQPNFVYERDNIIFEIICSNIYILTLHDEYIYNENDDIYNDKKNCTNVPYFNSMSLNIN